MTTTSINDMDNSNSTTNRRPLATGRLYHFNVIYNHARCPLSVTADTEMSLAWTRKAVEHLELTGLVNSYYHDRDCPKGQGLLQELSRVVAGSEVTVVLLSPGFVKDCWPRYWFFSCFKSLFTVSRLDSSSTTRITSSSDSVDYISGSSISSVRLSPRNSPPTNKASLTRLTPYSKGGRSSRKRTADGSPPCDVVLVALELEADDLPEGLREEDVLFFKDWRKDHEAWSRLEGSLVTSLHNSGVEFVRADRKLNTAGGPEGPASTSSPRSSPVVHRASSETSGITTITYISSNTSTSNTTDDGSSGQVSSSLSRHEISTSTSKIASITGASTSSSKSMDGVSSTRTSSSKSKHDYFSAAATATSSDRDKKTESVSCEIRSEIFSGAKTASDAATKSVSSTSNDSQSHLFLQDDSNKRNIQSGLIMKTSDSMSSESNTELSSQIEGSVQHSNLSAASLVSVRGDGVGQQRHEIKVTEKVEQKKGQQQRTEKMQVSERNAMRVEDGPVTTLVLKPGLDSTDGNKSSRSVRSEEKVMCATGGSGYSHQAMRVEKGPETTFVQSSRQHNQRTEEISSRSVRQETTSHPREGSRNMSSVCKTAHDETVAGLAQKRSQSEESTSEDRKEASSATMASTVDVESAVLNRLGQAGIKREYIQKKSTSAVTVEGKDKSADSVQTSNRDENRKKEQMSSASQSILTQKSQKEISNSALASEVKRNARTANSNKDHETQPEEKFTQVQTFAVDSAEEKSRYPGELFSQTQAGVAHSETTTQHSSSQFKQSVSISETVTTVCGTEQQIVSQRRLQSQTKASIAQASTGKDSVDSVHGTDSSRSSEDSNTVTFEVTAFVETGISGNQSTDRNMSPGKKTSLTTDRKDQSSAAVSITMCSSNSHTSSENSLQQQLHDTVKLSVIELNSSTTKEQPSAGVYQHVTSIEDDHEYLTSSLATSDYGTMSPRNDLSIHDDSGFLSGGLASFDGNGTSDSSVPFSEEKERPDEKYKTITEQKTSVTTTTALQSSSLKHIDSKNIVKNSGSTQESLRTTENTSDDGHTDIHAEESAHTSHPPQSFDRVPSIPRAEKPFQKATESGASSANIRTFDSSYESQTSDYVVSSLTTTTTTVTQSHLTDNEVTEVSAAPAHRSASDSSQEFQTSDHVASSLMTTTMTVTKSHIVDSDVIDVDAARGHRSASDADDFCALERRDSWIYQDVDKRWTVSEVLLPLYRIMVYMLSRPEMPYM